MGIVGLGLRGANLILRNKNVHNIFADNMLSTFVGRSICFPCAITISTNTYGNVSCVDHRPHHTHVSGVSCLTECRCVNVQRLMARKYVFSHRLLCSGFPGLLLPCSFSACFGCTSQFRVIAAGYLANGPVCLSRGRSQRHTLSVMHTSDDLPCIDGVISISNVPVLSNKVSSDVPIVETVSGNCRRGIIILAHGGN